VSGVFARRSERATLLVVTEATLLWAGVLLVGWGILYGGLIGGVVGFLVDRFMGDRAMRARENAARRAVLVHRDPGPDLRGEADIQARSALAANSLERWVPGLVLAGVAAACAVTAVLRGDPAVALPGPVLVVLAVVIVVLRRRTDAAAGLWLADPPFTRDGVEEGTPRTNG
jgi:hypothetical protein